MTRKWLISRRECLKGIGVALALPLLETMGWADPPKGGAPKFPVRFGSMYMTNGVWQPDFWPSDPKNFPLVLPKNLEPLRQVIDQCLLLNGIENAAYGALDGAPHALEVSSWLSATMPNANNRANIDIATTIDQIAAQQLGAYTALPSLELGWRDNSESGTGEAGLNNRYYTVGCYSSPTQPLPVETRPASVYKRLFSSRQSTPRKRGGPARDVSQFAGGTGAAAAGDAGGESLDRSMLDLVLEGAKDLRARVSVNDQRQLDDYLESLHSLETRIVAIEKQQAEAAKAKAGKSGKSQANMQVSDPIDVKLPSGNVPWSEHTRVMGELMILAFQSDVTRVCTMWPSVHHGISYPELGFSDNHHDLSHHGQDQDKISKLTKIDHFNIEQFAYIVGRMKQLREGPGTLLDNCIFMWGSGLEEGDTHAPQRQPTIIAGKGGGTITTGRYVAQCKGNRGDLLTGILARMGVKVDKPIGNGTKLTPDLS